jgi:ribosome-associated protein
VKPVRETKAPAAKKAAAKTPAAKKPAASKAVGKVVKVAPSKTETAAVAALKSLPPKRVRAVKEPAAPANAVPEKKVIKRIKKTDE